MGRCTQLRNFLMAYQHKALFSSLEVPIMVVAEISVTKNVVYCFLYTYNVSGMYSQKFLFPTALHFHGMNINTFLRYTYYTQISRTETQTPLGDTWWWIDAGMLPVEFRTMMCCEQMIRFWISIPSNWNSINYINMHLLSDNSAQKTIKWCQYWQSIQGRKKGLGLDSSNDVPALVDKFPSLKLYRLCQSQGTTFDYNVLEQDFVVCMLYGLDRGHRFGCEKE